MHKSQGLRRVAESGRATYTSTWSLPAKLGIRSLYATFLVCQQFIELCYILSGESIPDLVREGKVKDERLRDLGSLEELEKNIMADTNDEHLDLKSKVRRYSTRQFES